MPGARHVKYTWRPSAENRTLDGAVPTRSGPRMMLSTVSRKPCARAPVGIEQRTSTSTLRRIGRLLELRGLTCGALAACPSVASRLAIVGSVVRVGVFSGYL